MQLDDVQDILGTIGREYKFRYDIPIELEDYFAELLRQYVGSAAQVADWIKDRVKADFVTLGEFPEWKQDPEWPVFRGRPMIFVGQINRHIGAMDVSFFLFKDHKSGVTKVITQVEGSIP